MKKKVFISIISAICMFIIGTTIYAQSVYPSHNLLYSIGRLIKSQNSKPRTGSAGKIYAKGKDITITWDEVNEIKERMDLAKLQDSEESAYRFILERKVLLNSAEKAGYHVTDKEIDETIEAGKEEMSKNADEESEALMEGFGGVEQYWKTLKDKNHIYLSYDLRIPNG